MFIHGRRACATAVSSRVLRSSSKTPEPGTVTRGTIIPPPKYHKHNILNLSPVHCIQSYFAGVTRLQLSGRAGARLRQLLRICA